MVMMTSNGGDDYDIDDDNGAKAVTAVTMMISDSFLPS
jgi:hypothetical protein